MEIVYVLVGIVALVAVYFLFIRKSEPDKLGAAPKQELPAKREETKKSDEPKPKPAVAEKAKAAASKDAEPEKSARRAESSQSVEADIAVEAEAPVPSRPSLTRTRDVAGLRKGLAKSRGEEGFFGKLRALISGKKELNPAIAEEIEEILLSSDVGVGTTQAMLTRIKESLSKADLLDSEKVWSAVRDEAKRILEVDGKAGAFPLTGNPTVVLLVGVNGAGKTTTIGKLATKLQADGKKVVLAAGDTFRAAAVQQLVVWGERIGCDVVRGKDGADPGSVVFDAIKKAQETGAEVVLADTAGRLHTKTNLMAEMKKIAKTADKALAGAPHEVLLVVDATNGQNALAQAKEFKEHLELTGIVLTKLDGTAKGGVILGICDTFGVPVRFVGLGERPDDLRDFSPDEFVEALLGLDEEASAA
ncbi:MAG: signal recognition particle-docking protein FtsY [Myxococcales bacterium]|nr:signal recognition particle-docking protein FtsY [Myxococcales bacterium]